jgi:hypothetical protein
MKQKDDIVWLTSRVYHNDEDAVDEVRVVCDNCGVDFPEELTAFFHTDGRQLRICVDCPTKMFR